MEIRLVILFYPRKKFHAKQIFELSSSMQLGPDKALFETTTSAPDSARASLAPLFLFTIACDLRKCSGLHTRERSLKPKSWIRKGPLDPKHWLPSLMTCTRVVQSIYWVDDVSQWQLMILEYLNIK